MRKLMIAALAASTMISGVASAQGMGEVRRGQEEVRRGQQEARQAERRGDYQEAREDRREVREDRREVREDWQNYRERNRQVFRGGSYNGPRGYTHRQVTIGFQFQPAYYSSRYWVSNPSRYRLEAPGRYQRWIRYGNDVVLINTRNGRVLKVHRNFYW